MNISPAVVKHFEAHEAKVNHFYLDTKGIVTIGIGCVVTLMDCLMLPFLNKETLVNATTEEIKKDFEATKIKESGKVASYYKDGLVTYLPDSIIYELFSNRFQRFAKQLPTIFPEFEKYSEALKLVLLDMAFNLGISGLAFKFPKFCVAVREGKQEDAARECIRTENNPAKGIYGISKVRNEWTFRVLSQPETWYKV